MVRVAVEVDYTVTDAAALERAAVASVDAAEFSAVGGQTADEASAQRRSLVRGGPAEAVLWLLDPEDLLLDIPGVELEGAECSAEVVPDVEVPAPVGPDFGWLFPLCRCGAESCTECGGFQVTPRTAAALWSAAEVLSDAGYDDVERYGDDPCQGEGDWHLFDEYPKLTWREDAVWRRQAARCFDDLADDLEAGRWPSPTCAGEEMALHLILRYAKDATVDGWSGLESTFADLTRHEDDLDWEMLGEVLFQDHDIIELFDPERDGIEDPEAEENRFFGMGDYRPAAWFKSFLNASPRDGRRPFRR